jgi:hypothetical protein
MNHPYVSHEIARVQIADRLRQAEHARLVRQVRAARGPRRRLVAGWRFQWPSLVPAREPRKV